MQKCLFSLMFAFSLSTVTSPITLAAQTSKNAAGSYVNRAVEQMGGATRLEAIKSARIDYWGHRFLLEESERPDGPWIAAYEKGTELQDYEHGRLNEEDEQWGLGMEEGLKSSLIVADGVAQVNMGERHIPRSMEQVVDAQETLDFSANRLILAAQSASDLRALPDTRIHGEPYHAVAFTRDNIPVRIYLNAYTGLPGVVEWTRAYPYSIFWRVWGDVQNRLEYTAYQLLPGGVRLPLQYDLARNGQPFTSEIITKIELNAQLPQNAFEISPEVKTAFEQRKPHMTEGPPLGKPSPLVEGDESLVQFVGAWNCAIVKQPDGLVILEAPISGAHTQALLAEAHKRFPNVPMKAAITTSDAWPHFGGIREIVANSIPIYAVDLNQPILTRFINAPFKQSPDTLAKSPKLAKFHWISEKTIIGSGPNRLELYPMRNASGERMMMVYFPQHKLLYTSDLLQSGQNGPFFMMEYVREAADAARRENLSVDRFFGMHMPMSPWTNVEKALAATESGAPPKSEGN
ncbi:MAG TPA: MBL fold metallo-hydrolase [Terriglobales bacterium]|nr:MBL fold metallo-hydrolase [Terriglobales bacterium]